MKTVIGFVDNLKSRPGKNAVEVCEVRRRCKHIIRGGVGGEG